MKLIKQIATVGATVGGFLYAVKVALFLLRKQGTPTIDEIINL